MRREATKTGWEPIGAGDSDVRTCGPFSELARWDEVSTGVQDAIEKAARGGSCWPLVLIGPAGSGKTCAAVASVMRWGGKFWQLNEFCDLLIDAAQDRLYHNSCGVGYKITARAIWDEWRTAKLAVIDDVGTRTKVSDHQFDTLKRLLDSRELRPTIVTTNLQIDGIASVFDDRVASRLAGGTVIQFDGDRRLGRETCTH